MSSMPLKKHLALTRCAGVRSRNCTAGGPRGNDEVSGHGCINAERLHAVRGSRVPEEALVGVHVQVAAVAGHLV